MKKALKAMNKNRILPGIIYLLLVPVLTGSAAPSTGEAVVAGRVGKVQARVFPGSVHYGETEVIDLFVGSSIGENSRLMTGKNGRACMALSPGAVVCVAPETELTFSKLRHSADGLPQSEDDLIRRIHIDLHKGRILVHAGEETVMMDIQVRTEAGIVEAHGGTFVVGQIDGPKWGVIAEEGGPSLTPTSGSPMEVPEGTAVSLTLTDQGLWDAKEDAMLLDSPAREFEVCNSFFDDLETFTSTESGTFDREGLSQYIGAENGISTVGSSEFSQDVSPSIPVPVDEKKKVARTPAASAAPVQWESQQAWSWYENQGAIKGVNYIPRNAVNPTEMWMEDTFDPDLISDELNWAEKIGYTTLRVQLQYAVWKEDPQGFLDRVDRFLSIADSRSLQVVPILFDDRNFAQAEPVVGPQPDPVPGAHNAAWTPSPGRSAVTNYAVWPELEAYVRSVIEKFKSDRRIVYWDLYNRTGDSGLGEESFPLMERVFNWARDVNPDQPLAAAAWMQFGSAMTQRKLERSDIITFQSFESPEQVKATLDHLRKYNRPIICSDWLMRQNGNDFEKILPLFSMNRVGWFNQGLVKGKTQQWIQEEKRRSADSPDVWQADVLKENGEPYDPEEIKLIQEFRFQDRF